MNTPFAETLKKLRKEKGISQAQLGNKMFVNSSTVTRWENGTRLPDAAMITRLAKVLEVDVGALGCDLYAFPGHKSLLGPQGTGGLYIRPGITLGTLREGGTGSASDSLIQPMERPERYEAGTVNLPGIAGLGAGVEYVAPRLSQIMMRERELTSALMEGLSAIPGIVIYSPAEEAARAGIVAFNLGDLPSAQAADALARRGYAVRGGLHCAPGAHRFLGTLSRGAVRASVGPSTTFEEIEGFVDAVRQLTH